MTYLICRNKVADFARWKRVFDSHAEAQRQFGLRLEHLWRSIDDPNEVFMLFQVDDLDKARGFVASPQVPGARQASGVIDQPDIYFVRSA
jgi:hypothetical protein